MKDQFFTYEVFLNYECVYLLADAIERAKSTRREAIIDALATSTWDRHFMPYGPTKFVNGQNQGAQPLMMQVLKGDIEVDAAQHLRAARAGLPVEGQVLSGDGAGRRHAPGRAPRHPCSSSRSSSRRS